MKPMTRSTIKRRRRNICEVIRNRVSHKESLESISEECLQTVISMYDRQIFHGKLARLNVSAKWNRRCTSAAGFFVSEQPKIEVSYKVMMHASRKIDKTGYALSFGIPCRSILHVLEHEMVHALMHCSPVGPMAWSGETDSNHSKSFMVLVNRLFGHNTFMHSFLLPSPSL